MKLKMSPTALAVVSLCAAIPLNAQSAPTVSFSAPANGGTVSGTLSGSACQVNSGSSLYRVRFSVDSTTLNTDYSSPYNCSLDTRTLSNGTHVLKATAWDSAGASATTQVSINVQNGTTTSAPSVSGSAPSISFRAPTNGGTVSGTLSGSACQVNSGSSLYRVRFSVDSTTLNSDYDSPYNCSLDTRTLSNGTHTLKATAWNSAGAASTTQISINVQNGTTNTNTAPTLSLTSPAANATISSTNAGFAATASDSDGVAKVEMFIGTKVVASKTTAPYSGTMNLTGIANGSYTLTARATDTKGLSRDVARTITVQNTSGSTSGSTGGGTSTTGGTGTSLPSTNARAVATFESLGMYWKPGTNPGSAGCTVRYRKKSESAWKQGLNLWYDSRDAECRGSIVHLQPGTDYVVEMGLPGQQPKAGVNTKTWSENFPIAQTINVGNRSTPLEITQGGTANGYILYTGGTIDVANSHAYNIRIAAPYVIVRGFTLKNARQDGILLVEGAKDVVIEGNDISNWGRPHPTGKISSDGWKIGENGDSGIAARCGSGSTPWLERTIIQRNKIHHPRYGSNSWSDGHPYGPNATLFKNCGGNHVFRFNEAYSSTGRYFMDVYGGGTNFSMFGMPTSDSDIYGNILMHAWDDAIEAEGSNMNVRIWGNYMDQTATGVATTSTSRGPVYIFRNVQNRSRNKSMSTFDGDSRLYTYKSGSASGYEGGRRYVFHNTSLQAPPPAGSSYPLGAGSSLAGPGNGQMLKDTVSRNNIFHIWKSHWNAIYNVESGNDLDYDMTNGGIQAYSGAEPNRVIGTPIYAAGHGWQSEAGGNYQLAPNSPGYDKGVRIPNFNDGFTGAGPDMGAHEAGKPPMQLGVDGTSH